MGRLRRRHAEACTSWSPQWTIRKTCACSAKSCRPIHSVATAPHHRCRCRTQPSGDDAGGLLRRPFRQATAAVCARGGAARGREAPGTDRRRADRQTAPTYVAQEPHRGPQELVALIVHGFRGGRRGPALGRRRGARAADPVSDHNHGHTRGDALASTLRYRREDRPRLAALLS